MAVPESDVILVWEAHRQYHPTARATPSRGGAREIKAALGADYSAADLVLLVQWAHEAPGKKPSFLRGPAYEGGESNVGDYLGVENLMRRATLDDRIALAKEWESKGRVNFRDVPLQANPQARVERVVKVLVEIVASGGDPAETSEPKVTRAVLDGMYALGLSVQYLGGIDRDRVKWEYAAVARKLIEYADGQRAARVAG